MRREDFGYLLPPALIAQTPLAERDAGRLLDVTQDACQHRLIRDLPELLQPGDLLVVNDTQVIKARLRGVKDSGGNAEILVERILDDNSALCQIRVSKKLLPGRCILLESADGNERLEILSREGEFYRLAFPEPVLEVLERYGQTPLPPYITRPADEEDLLRYQTVFNQHAGAVAAPTAGLHFSTELLSRIAQRETELATLTLHVGAGTFQPIRVSDLQQHKMHTERYFIPAATTQAIANVKRRGGNVVAVGTTVVRALESALQKNGAALPDAGWGETELFITPGFKFECVDVLVTNFHQPESSLLMLVCAFAGYEKVMNAYRLAVENQYRFFSYGDAMLLQRSAKGKHEL